MECLICGKPTDKPGNACSIECAERFRNNYLRLKEQIKNDNSPGKEYWLIYYRDLMELE